MATIRYCPYCANELQHREAKFCGKCGESLAVLHPTTNSSKELSEKSVTAAMNEKKAPSDKTKESVQGAFSTIKQATKESPLKGQAVEYVEKVKQNPKKQKDLIAIVSIVAVVFFLGFGWHWFSNREYRQTMATADSYFSQGKYGEAAKFYQQAHDEKPGDKRAIEFLGYSEELGTYWIQLNDNDFSAITLDTVEELKEQMTHLKNNDVKKKYAEVVKTIEQSNSYQIEKETIERYKRAYDIGN